MVYISVMAWETRLDVPHSFLFKIEKCNKVGQHGPLHKDDTHNRFISVGSSSRKQAPFAACSCFGCLGILRL